MKKLNELGAREAAKRLASRDITAEALARACPGAHRRARGHDRRLV